MARTPFVMSFEIVVGIVALVLIAGTAIVVAQRRNRRAVPPAAKAPAALPEPEPEPAVTEAPAAPDAAPEPAEARPQPAPEPTAPQAPSAAPAPDGVPTPAIPRFAPPPRVAPAPVVAPPKPVPLPVDKPAPKPDAAAIARAERARQAARYREGLAKTRGGFVARLSRLFRGKPKVDDDLKDQIEEVLFTADIGAATAQKLLTKVTEVLDRKDVADADAVWATIRAASLEILDVPHEPVAPGDTKPYVMLMIGVNGVGKTTTLGKLAARHVEAGRKVLLVAGDTFRAAAVEQLDVWARRTGCELHVGRDQADPSSVIFDGISRAQAEDFDVVLCDTAGRLHTRKELMDELAKVRRASEKAIAKARNLEDVAGSYDTFLVLDATIGQNALAQAKLFKQTMDFTGMVMTKLDGTAKGGVLLGVCDELRLPVRYIGIGEKQDDLREFDPAVFCDALYDERERPALALASDVGA